MRVQVRGLARQQVALVEPLQQFADPPQLAADRPPFGFARMRGEHQFHVQPVEQPLQVVRRVSLRRQLGDRRPDRLGPRGGMRRPFALAQDPHALPVLGHVHQVQEDTQGPGHHASLVAGQRREFLGQLPHRPRAARVSSLGQLADVGDRRQTFRARDLLDRPVEPVLQPADGLSEFMFGHRWHRAIPCYVASHYGERPRRGPRTLRR